MTRDPSRPHSGRARDGFAPVRIIAGRVVDVDPTRWMAEVKAEETTGQTFRNIPIGSPYAHPFDGEGLHIMPEPGAPVWVVLSSEGDYPPYISGYRAYTDKGASSQTNPTKPGARMNRPPMNPGDIFIRTRDRNGVKFRRGGVTEILGSPLSRTIYLARGGKVYTICQNYALDTFGGRIRWLVARSVKDPAGKQGTSLTAAIKEYADDKGHVVHLEAGGQLKLPVEGDADGDSGTYGAPPESGELVSAPVLRLRIYQDGDVAEDSLQEASSLAFDKNGQIELALVGQLNIEIRGSKNVTLRLAEDGTAELEADTTITTTVGELSTVNDGETVKVGEGTAKVLYDRDFSSMAAAAWTQVSAIGKAVGMPTTDIDAMITALELEAFTSDKLETE